jgi:hypothetical protein
VTPTASPACTPGWSVGPDVPAPAMVRAVGVYFPTNGRFYAVGGRSSDTAGNNFTHPLEYDPCDKCLDDQVLQRLGTTT